ncbi:uncharacterized protein LOC128263805 [Drosophila gunungcola]|uniref:DUF4706 domain-containing protein n=1 Tax=Drosophila gunungcola TaxID=103775 RepID=A0A9P9YGP9_9MUSC|nr:uncharacterized protein LOC128263805 [Drosophila gunungcola]KAI8036463.1 hypothetical protein M5D96_010769 [Drosophila gunungcola]
MATHEGIHSYFSKLSSLSEKITRDVNNVKSAYSPEAWLKLTLNEQEKILNSHLINPDIYTKYYNRLEEQKRQIKTDNLKNDQKLCFSDAVYSFNGKDLHTYILQNVGLKLLHDENTRDSRDEHSFPFSYRTKSQIKISLKECDEVSDPGVPIDASNVLYLTLMTNVSRSPKLPSLHTYDCDMTDVNQSKVITNLISDQKSICVYNNEECFDSNQELQLLVSFGSKSSMSNDLSDNENEFKDIRQDENAKLLTPEIPKGFDFLNNW